MLMDLTSECFHRGEYTAILEKRGNVVTNVLQLVQKLISWQKKNKTGTEKTIHNSPLKESAEDTPRAQHPYPCHLLLSHCPHIPSLHHLWGWPAPALSHPKKANHQRNLLFCGRAPPVLELGKSQWQRNYHELWSNYQISQSCSSQLCLAIKTTLEAREVSYRPDICFTPP